MVKEQGVIGYFIIFWFLVGSKEGIKYKGGCIEEKFLEFVNENVGIYCLFGGDFDIIVGIIEVLDIVVVKFIGFNIVEFSGEVLKQVELLKDIVQYKYVEYYVKVFDKFSNSDGYVVKELVCFDGIFIKGGFVFVKCDEIQLKINVFCKFILDVVEKVQEKVEEIKDEL